MSINKEVVECEHDEWLIRESELPINDELTIVDYKCEKCGYLTTEEEWSR